MAQLLYTRLYIHCGTLYHDNMVVYSCHITQRSRSVITNKYRSFQEMKGDAEMAI